MSAQIIPFPATARARQPTGCQRTGKPYMRAYDQLIHELCEMESAETQRPDWQAHVEAVLDGDE